MGQPKLIINGVDFGRFARRDGLAFPPVERNRREVTTVDGTLHERVTLKAGLRFEAIELRGTTYAALRAALTPRLASVTWNPGDDAADRTGSFYLTETAPSATVVRGNTTYYAGFGVEGEER